MKNVMTITLAVTIAVGAMLAAATLTSCKDDKSKRLDPNAMISLRPDMTQAANAATKANPEHLSAIEIVKQCIDISFWNRSLRPDQPTGRGFGDHQRDTIDVRLMMFGTDIIRQNGELETDFIGASDLVFRRLTAPYPDFVEDTIGYIPNSVMREAEEQIKIYYAEQNYAAVYELFDRIFRFTPITGAEWRALKAQGLN